jgi:Flp pilus assembly protein TadG
VIPRRARILGAASRSGREGGQGLVEMSLALLPFIVLLMGVVDLGRGVYTNNGVAQAAREIARVTSVHQCSGSCSTATWSAETLATVNTQKKLVPGLADAGVVITCVDITNAPKTVAAEGCPAGEFIRVDVATSFHLVTPLLPIPNPMTLSSTAHIQVP